MTNFIDESINIKVQWKVFCDGLLANLSLIEKRTEDEYHIARKNGESYQDRNKYKTKLDKCKEYRLKIQESAKSKEFELNDGDEEIIIINGFDYYFRTLNGNI